MNCFSKLKSKNTTDITLKYVMHFTLTHWMICYFEEIRKASSSTTSEN